MTTVYALDTLFTRVRDTNGTLRGASKVTKVHIRPSPLGGTTPFPALGGATVNCKPQGQNSFKSMPFAITCADQNVIDKRRVSNGPSRLGYVRQGRAGQGGPEEEGGGAFHVQSVLWVCCVLDESCQKCHGKCSNANADGATLTLTMMR